LKSGSLNLLEPLGPVQACKLHYQFWYDQKLMKL
jgi:hypothetical protein